jgi:hypothetical protein
LTAACTIVPQGACAISSVITGSKHRGSGSFAWRTERSWRILRWPSSVSTRFLVYLRRRSAPPPPPPTPHEGEGDELLLLSMRKLLAA